MLRYSKLSTRSLVRLHEQCQLHSFSGFVFIHLSTLRFRSALPEALIAGQRDPRKLGALTDRRLKASTKELYDALHGRLTDHHHFLLQLHLRQYEALDEAVREIDHEAEARLSRLDRRIEPKPVSRLNPLLVTIRGVSRLSALTILWKSANRRSSRRLGGPVFRPE
jgi:transposase